MAGAAIANTQIKLADGTSLNVYSAEAVSKTNTRNTAKAVVHINHGMCEHAERYARFMHFLAENGYHSIAQDHRGHGKTQAKDAPLGTFSKRDGWSKLVADAHAVNRHASGLYDGLPVIVFGHSMGAALALEYTLAHPDTVSAAAIWNGATSGLMPKLLTAVLKVERALKGSDCVSSWAPALSFDAWNKEFAPNRTDFDWLSRDEKEVDKYIADPLCGFNASIGMWIDLLDGLNNTAELSRYKALPKDLPFHIINGEADPCSNKGGSAAQLETRLRKTGHTDIAKSVLKDTRHESLNELNRDAVMGDFVNWLDARFS